jgi:hypothetical protein
LSYSGYIKSTDGQNELSVDQLGSLSALSFTNHSGTFVLEPNGNDGAKLTIKSGASTQSVYVRYDALGVILSASSTTSSGIRISSGSIDIL